MKIKYHPFWKKDSTFKYIYCFGLGTMAMGHMKAITETRDYFEVLLEQIRLPLEQRQQIIIDINNHFEQRIQEVFERIKTKEVQYCFVLDLYKLLSLTSWAREYCSQVLENYLQIFQLSAVERNFFQKFCQAMEENNLAQGQKACQCFTEEGYSIRYDFLVYFYPKFNMQEQYEDLHIEAGKTVVLDKPVTIKNDIIVERGGSLLIYGGIVSSGGSIQVLGGRIQIQHALIQIMECDSPFWLNLHNTAVVSIEDSMIDCGGKCGMLRQSQGRLIVENSRIENTDGQYAIAFSGTSARIFGSNFSTNRRGAVSVSGASYMEVGNSNFTDASADYGGGISSDSMEDILIWDCQFKRCTAKYLGAAIYFRHQKLGQRIENCRFLECDPKDSISFNEYK